MSHVHQDHGTTIVRDDREGLPGVIVALIVAALIGFVVWFFAFSGVMTGDGDAPAPTNIEQNFEGGGGTTTEPEPAPAES